MSEWRQKRLSSLTNENQAAKLKADAAYEIAVRNIYADNTLTTAEKQAQKATLWANYEATAKLSGWWEEVTDEQLLTEAETALDLQVQEVNTMRAKLNLGSVTIDKGTTKAISLEEA